MFSYASDNDVITDFGANDTVRSTSGTLTYKVSGDDVLVTIKKSGQSKVGNITLKGAAVYKDHFKKTSSALYVKGINIIENTQDNKKLTGKTSNDGVDFISNTGEHVTIQAGVGNDIITGSDLFGDHFLFSYASGDDTITNFGTGDTLQMTSGSSLTYKKSGNDYIVTIKKSGQSKVGTVTLKDAADYYTLQKSGSAYIARPKTTSTKQLPAEDYWFLGEEATVERSELNEIVSTETAVNLPEDFFADALERKENLLTYSARKHQNSFKK